MFGNRFSSSTSCSRSPHETESGRPNPSLSCCFLKVATHPDELTLDLYRRLPEIRIPDILLEVDQATGFTDACKGTLDWKCNFQGWK